MFLHNTHTPAEDVTVTILARLLASAWLVRYFSPYFKTVFTDLLYYYGGPSE